MSRGLPICTAAVSSILISTALLARNAVIGGPIPVCDTAQTHNASTLTSRQIDQLPMQRSLESLRTLTPVQAISGDFNGDGCRDAGFAYKTQNSGQLAIFEGYGDGTFQLPAFIPLDGSPTSVATGDLDGDAITDIIVGESTGFELFGGGLNGNTFANNASVSAPFPIIDVATGPLTGGGFDNFAVLGGANNRGDANVYIDDFKGAELSFEKRLKNRWSLRNNLSLADWSEHFQVPDDPRSIAIGPANLPDPKTGVIDATPDIFVGHENRLDVFMNPTWQSSLTGSYSIPGVKVELGDVNGDGEPDIISANPGDSAFYTLLGNPIGGYRQAYPTPLSATVLDFLLGNLTSTAREDVALTTMTSGPNAQRSGVTASYDPKGNGQYTFSAPYNAYVPAIADRLADGVPTDDIVGIGPMGYPTWYGSNYPGSPRMEYGFGLGPGPNTFDFDDEDFDDGVFTVILMRRVVIINNQIFIIEVTETIVLPPPLLGEPEPSPARRGFLASLGSWLIRRPELLMASSGSWQTTSSSTRSSQPGSAPRGPAVAGRITSLGVSTGDAFQIDLTNSGRQPANIMTGAIVVEPVQTDGSPMPSPAGASKTSVHASGYCLDFSKEVPPQGTVYRPAPKAVQQQMRPLRNILTAARQLAQRNLLHADTSPDTYFDAIRQWALWTKREGWDQKKFGESFIERTKKNLANMKQAWTKEIENQVRGLIPNRWRDITQILTTAAGMK